MLIAFDSHLATPAYTLNAQKLFKFQVLGKMVSTYLIDRDDFANSSAIIAGVIGQQLRTLVVTRN